MDLNIQHVTKVKDYILSIDSRRCMLALLIPLLLFLFFTLRQFTFQSPHFMVSLYKSLNKTVNSTNQTTLKSPITKMIVVSHFNEDLDWLDLFISDRIPYIVYTRSTDPLARYNIAINKGREAVAYLRYIVDHYSDLPATTAFVHAHRTSWHQKDPPDIVIALRALRWNKYNYTSLTSAMTNSRFKPDTGDIQTTVNYELWRDVLQKELGPPPVNGINAPCCATFAAKREAILFHPKKFYSDVSDYIIASPHSDQYTGRTLEYTWHMIFGEPASVNYKKCDIFVCNPGGNISVQLAEKNL